MTFTHTTEPAGSGTTHYWSYGDEQGSITAVAFQASAGSWMFRELAVHKPDGTPGCKIHHGCSPEVFSPVHGEASWRRIVAGGVTDEAVRAELEFRWHDEFAPDGVR